MAKQSERMFGQVPDWSKTGPIGLRNYPFRAEAHCHQRSSDRQGHHPTIKLGSVECDQWRQYFEVHLGGLPHAMEMLLGGKIVEMTVPEPVPMWFDPSFEPDPKWVARPYEQRARPGRLHPETPPGEDYYAMFEKYGAPIGRSAA